MKNQILIVGGAGYIGSHVTLHLLENNYDVIVLDDLSTGSKDAVLTEHFYQGDLADRKLLKSIFSKHQITGVMHFAAHVVVDESVHNPIKYYDNNFSKSLVLLDEMIKHNINYFVFSSTAAVYGEPTYTPVDTNHQKLPINPYGRSKLMLEEALKDFDRAYGLKSSILRYFNAAGADPKGKIGFHEPITHLVPQVLKAASGRKDAIAIYGTDYDTKDGTCIRDYIHVMDLASAHLLAFEHLLKYQSSTTHNLGNGEGYSILEVINSVKNITNQNFKVIHSERRDGDPAILIADSESAKKELNWKPQYSLDEIIEDSWAWELNPKWHK
ncbi:UDP-glucose 4-epimerase GalE [Thiotrichales bacterium 19S9-12]|nr:UDP-glucose 4-epimerase GalE [Thiotrichales bacterium 19S9-11]MCF6811750.1 UDP-glucose 4-epimerase GalE [Thiotrichales bacterium 19S9-12]